MDQQSKSAHLCHFRKPFIFILKTLYHDDAFKFLTETCQRISKFEFYGLDFQTAQNGNFCKDFNIYILAMRPFPALQKTLVKFLFSDTP